MPNAKTLRCTANLDSEKAEGYAFFQLLSATNSNKWGSSQVSGTEEKEGLLDLSSKKTK